MGDLSHPEQSENVERTATNLFGEDMDADLKAAVTITEGILSTSPDIPTKRLLYHVMRQMKELSDDRIAQEVEAKKSRYETFIKGRRKKLEEELQKAQNPEEEYQLKQEYKEAMILAILVKTEVIETLMSNLLNPYTIANSNSCDELDYSPAMETATMYNPKSGKWESDWTPEVHHSPLTGRFITPETTQAIRKGLELYFEMRSRILDIKGQIDKNDSDQQQAQKILDTILGAKSPRLKGKASIIFTPISITIVLDNEDDLKNIYGDEQARNVGGFHHCLSSNDGFSKGLLNIVRGGIYRTSQGIANTVAHEQEHSLNEIFIRHNRSESTYKDLRTIVSEQLGILNSEQKTEEVPDARIERALKFIVEQTLAKECGEQLEGFADEALAHMLNNKRSADETLDVLTKNELYKYLQPEKLEIATMGGVLGYGLDREIGSISSGSGPFQRLTRLYRSKREEIRSSILDKLKFFQRQIVDAIQTLQRAGLEDNEIRALFAGENPAKWMKIAKKIRNQKSYDPKEKWKTRGRTIVLAKERQLRKTAKTKLEEDRTKIEALIEALENKESSEPEPPISS